MKTTWKIKKIDQSIVSNNSKILNINKTIASLLYSRGLTSPSEIDKFLHTHYSDLHSPFYMHGMYDAVARIKKAIDSKEKIGIFSDSDLDGITSLALLYNLFLKMKIIPFYRFLKDDETYGLTHKIIDEFKSNNIQLLITVDSGIRDSEEINYAKSLGIDVIVSDHHEQDDYLPEAIIIDPKTNECQYPFKNLAGVGVAFKLCHALLLSYLPSFNKLFLIITNDNNHTSISLLKNGIVEEQYEITSLEQLDQIISVLNSDDIILFYEADPIEKDIRVKYSSKKIFNFIEFIRAFFKRDSISLQALCKELFINSLLFNKIDLLNKIFLEIQYSSSGKIKQFIDSVIGFVSIGTIADVMPLIDENRILVRSGIDALNKTSHPGLSFLINNKKIKSKEISWDIAPLLNSPGRLGKTELTVNFFLENDLSKLHSIINSIRVMNDDRKDIVNKLYSKIFDDINENKIKLKNIIFIKSSEIPDGLAGLIANRFADITEKPVIVAAHTGKDRIIKCSGRIKEKFNFFSYVEPFCEKFERIGGHAQAFGFTVMEDIIDDIIVQIDRSLDDISIPPKIFNIDLELDINLINNNFINEILKLEPFGNGNEEPIFLSRDIAVESFSRFGNNNHGKYTLLHNNAISVIGWNIADEMEKYFINKNRIDIIYKLENNIFKGEVYSQLIIIDMVSFNEGEYNDYS